MSRYILAVEAQQDLREIRDYLIGEGGPRVARDVVGTFILRSEDSRKHRGWDIAVRT